MEMKCKIKYVIYVIKKGFFYENRFIFKENYNPKGLAFCVHNFIV